MEKVVERFSKYMEYKGLNDNKVTVEAGLSIGLLGKARKGEKDLGKNSIEKLIKVYNDIDYAWLLTGVGDMIKKEKSIETKTEDECDEESLIPFLLEQNKSQQKTIEYQAYSIKKMQDTIERLHEKLGKDGK